MKFKDNPLKFLKRNIKNVKGSLYSWIRTFHDKEIGMNYRINAIKSAVVFHDRYLVALKEYNNLKALYKKHKDWNIGWD